MEKIIHQFVKRQATSNPNFNPIVERGSTGTLSISSLVTPNGLANIQRELSALLKDNSQIRLVTLFDLEAFKYYLNDKIPHSIRSSVHYNLNSKLLPCMIPKCSNLSVFHPSLFKSAIKLTEHSKITFSNPFKSFEGIEAAANLGVQTVVVNTPEEIEKIQTTNQKFKYIWEFDEIDYKQSKNIFKALASKKICLSGLRFKELPLSSLPETQKCIQLGYKYGHQLSSNTYQMSLNELPAFRAWSKSSSSKILPLISDLDTADFVICASKVIGKNKKTKVYSDLAREVMDEGRTGISVEINSKQWTLFSPKKMHSLEQISDVVVNLNMLKE